MKSQSVKIDFDSIPWQRVFGGGRFGRSKAWEQRGTRIRILEFSPKWHEEGWCNLGHTGYVLNGILVLTFRSPKQKRVKVLKGEGFSIPEGLEHKAACTTVTRAFIVDKT